MTASRPVDRVLSRLAGVRRSGDGWAACCPAHDDRRASLSVGRGDDGRVLLHCHAGCAPEQIAGAMGLAMADLFVGGGNGTRPRVRRPRNVPPDAQLTTYEYTDADGRPLWYRDRWDWVEGGVRTKLCLPRQPDGKRAGSAPVPYRLPALRRAIAARELVILVEGEKAADALTEHGFVATTTGPATSWRSDYAQHFRGARLVLWPDADEPGEQYIAAAARDLAPVVAELRVLRIPDARPHYDAADFFADGGTADQLDRLLAEAPAYAADASTAPEDDAAPLPQARCATELATYTPPAFLIDDFLLEAEPALFTADGGAGKTTAAITVCGCLAAEVPLFEHSRFRPRRTGNVLYVMAEDPPGFLHNRLEALIAGHGWDAARVRERFHYLTQAGVLLEEARWQAHLIAEVKRLSAVLVVLDPLFELTLVKETNEDLKPIIRFLRHLIAETGATPLLVHDAGKITEGKRKLDRIRGASSLNQRARTIWFLEERPEGSSFECLKMSRSEKPPPFVVRRTIESDPHQRALWRSARLTYVSEVQAEKESAERFVLEQLARYRDGVKSTGLRELAKGKHSGEDIAEAVKSLAARGVIAFRPGPRGAKLWALTAPPEDLDDDLELELERYEQTREGNT